MEIIKIICYLFFAYGISNIVVYGDGPFNILLHFRSVMRQISQNMGNLFSCMMCLSANIGIIFSLIDIYMLENINITPFNILINNNEYWWMVIIMDLGVTSGVVWLINIIEESLNNKNG